MEEISVRSIKGIGEKTQKLLAGLGVFNVRQLLHYYPRAYTTYPEPIPISEVDIGRKCSVRAKPLLPVRLRRWGKRQAASLLVEDESGVFYMQWYNMPYLNKVFDEGKYYIFTGTAIFRDGRYMFLQPEISREDQYRQKMKSFQPVYRLTAGLKNNVLRKALKEACAMQVSDDYLPDEVRNYYELLPEGDALVQIHFPTGDDELARARKRIIFDEFFRFFQALSLLEEQQEKSLNTHLIEMDDRVESFIQKLPFALTAAQKRTIDDIRKDFSGTASMNRLVQGDVGSGKTIVAVVAMYAAALKGYQAVMMAPTEVLADQHYHTVKDFMAPLGIRVDLLKGGQDARTRREVKARLADGQTHILIGTHAVIQKDVEFADLALVITDEQHRFGVSQRDALMKKGHDPHVLVMSATPIPRTLAIILYRNMDVSIMDELPASRLPIKNSVVNTRYRPNAWRFIEKQVAMGHRAYVICPMIDEDGQQNLENVQGYTQMLQAAMPSSMRIASLNGRMSAREKSDIMEEFGRGQIDILVSTTVIEVGIDVPEATVILIENADRFGLSQLHQLRGRVGRGRDQSYCIFMSGTDSKEAMDRLMVVGKSNDGFAIANEDLKMRGPGDFFGTRQSGMMEFALGDIYENADIMKMAREAVDEMKSRGELMPPGDLSSIEESLNFARNI